MTAEQKAAYEKEQVGQGRADQENKALNDAFNAGSRGAGRQAMGRGDCRASKRRRRSIRRRTWCSGVWATVIRRRPRRRSGADQQAVLEKAVGAYQKAIELKPDAPEYHNNYALALAGQKKFPEAQAELQKAAQLDPTNGGKYYYNMGAVLVNTGKLEPAGNAFKKAIELDPNYADAYFQYGITLMGKATTGSDGKMIPVAGTADAFNKYLELAPNGRDAETAKAMLQQIGAKVETNFAKPSDPKKKK